MSALESLIELIASRPYVDSPPTEENPAPLLLIRDPAFLLSTIPATETIPSTNIQGFNGLGKRILVVYRTSYCFTFSQ